MISCPVVFRRSSIALGMAAVSPKPWALLSILSTDSSNVDPLRGIPTTKTLVIDEVLVVRPAFCSD